MQFKSRSMALLIFIAGVTVNARSEITIDIPGRRPVNLVMAVSDNNVKIVRELLAKGADPNAHIGNSEETVLFRAASHGYEDVGRMLLEAGADPLARDKGGLTPFHEAVSSGHKSFAKLLLAKGADFDCKTIDGQTPLLIAVKRGHKDAEDTALWLLEIGANPNAESMSKSSSGTVLLYAAQRGMSSLVESLVRKGVRVDCRAGEFQRSPLDWAVTRGDANSVKALITGGCDLGSTDAQGQTCIHLCVTYGNSGQVAILDLLMAAGADINIKDKYGRTALDWAKNRTEEAERSKIGSKESRDAELATAKALLSRVQYYLAQGSTMGRSDKQSVKPREKESAIGKTNDLPANVQITVHSEDSNSESLDPNTKAAVRPPQPLPENPIQKPKDKNGFGMPLFAVLLAVFVVGAWLLKKK